MGNVCMKKKRIKRKSPNIIKNNSGSTFTGISKAEYLTPPRRLSLVPQPKRSPDEIEILYPLGNGNIHLHERDNSDSLMQQMPFLSMKSNVLTPEFEKKSKLSSFSLIKQISSKNKRDKNHLIKPVSTSAKIYKYEQQIQTKYFIAETFQGDYILPTTNDSGSQELNISSILSEEESKEENIEILNKNNKFKEYSTDTNSISDNKVTSFHCNLPPPYSKVQNQYLEYTKPLKSSVIFSESPATMNNVVSIVAHSASDESSQSFSQVSKFIDEYFKLKENVLTTGFCDKDCSNLDFDTKLSCNKIKQMAKEKLTKAELKEINNKILLLNKSKLLKSKSNAEKQTSRSLSILTPVNDLIKTAGSCHLVDISENTHSKQLHIELQKQNIENNQVTNLTHQTTENNHVERTIGESIVGGFNEIEENYQLELNPTSNLLPDPKQLIMILTNEYLPTSVTVQDSLKITIPYEELLNFLSKKSSVVKRTEK